MKNHLSGEYECRIDAKGRLKLPAGLVRQLGESGTHSFTLNRGFERCAVIYPKSIWDSFTEALKKLNPLITKNRKLLRAFYRGATPVVSDAADRVRIPQGLIDYAGIGKEVVVVAIGVYIEVWEKQAYLDHVESIDSDEIAELADQVFATVGPYLPGLND